MENLNFEPTRDWLVVPKPDKKVTGDVVYIHPSSDGVIIELNDSEYVMINESMAVLGIVK